MHNQKGEIVTGVMVVMMVVMMAFGMVFMGGGHGDHAGHQSGGQKMEQHEMNTNMHPDDHDTLVTAPVTTGEQTK